MIKRGDPTEQIIINIKKYPFNFFKIKLTQYYMGAVEMQNDYLLVRPKKNNFKIIKKWTT